MSRLISLVMANQRCRSRHLFRNSGTREAPASGSYDFFNNRKIFSSCKRLIFVQTARLGIASSA